MPMNKRSIAAYIGKDRETSLYIGVIPAIPGAHTQGETLDELHKNLKEVVRMCLKQMSPEEKERLPEFVGIQQVEVGL
ncbi:MAG TPA: type II toxin-antitoxin system HicB family antitoxin [Candidatus Deferrimicrobium sp.]|nr:type II toxin-antitoxin system HicB family antitoxin [Candidatus Deferrimicrobium sp.]